MTSFIRPTLITITAPTCSGKSYLLDKLAYNGTVSRIVSTTTRPIRNGEKNGIDYDFISMEQSLELESAGRFFELITFNGTRYGVTHEQMASAMADARPPAVVLEPQGLEIYTQKCRENGWDVFKVYVHTIESERISRLHYRTVNQMWAAIDPAVAPSLTSMGDVFREMATERLKASIGPIIREHDRRLLSITGEERRWQNSTCWDAIVPGDDVEKAIAMIEQGIQWRNTRVTAGFN
jgi:guanylate kinase